MMTQCWLARLAPLSCPLSTGWLLCDSILGVNHAPPVAAAPKESVPSGAASARPALPGSRSEPLNLGPANSWKALRSSPQADAAGTAAALARLPPGHSRGLRQVHLVLVGPSSRDSHHLNH